MARPIGKLTIDLSAIQNNWRFLKAQLSPGTECGAVVKANAYGLGVERVAPKLAEAGCNAFFVATLAEAIELKPLLPASSRILVLCGCYPGEEDVFIARGFIPVIVSVPMLERWRASVKKHSSFKKQSSFQNQSPAYSAGAVLKINTGMSRLGVEVEEFITLLERPESLAEVGLTCLMSHFACADEPQHPLNQRQLDRFNDCVARAKKIFPQIRATLSNSSGIFLSPVAHFDLVRPGISIYGGNPQPQKPNPMAPVVNLQLPVLQTRKLPAGESVGYGATNSELYERFLVTVAGGYADGIMRIMGNRGFGFFNQTKVPIVGRVSMDTTVFDVTAIPAAHRPGEGDTIELLGKHICIDELADAVGTIGYEILTSLGSRYERTYIS